jgi:hypothetical protein
MTLTTKMLAPVCFMLHLRIKPIISATSYHEKGDDI